MAPCEPSQLLSLSRAQIYGAGDLYKHEIADPELFAEPIKGCNAQASTPRSPPPLLFTRAPSPRCSGASLSSHAAPSRAALTPSRSPFSPPPPLAQGHSCRTPEFRRYIAPYLLKERSSLRTPFVLRIPKDAPERALPGGHEEELFMAAPFWTFGHRVSLRRDACVLSCLVALAAAHTLRACAQTCLHVSVNLILTLILGRPACAAACFLPLRRMLCATLTSRR